MRNFRLFLSRLNKVINLSLFDQQFGFVRWLLLVCNKQKGGTSGILFAENVFQSVSTSYEIGGRI